MCRGSDHVAVRKGIGCLTRRDEPRNVRHVRHQERAHVIRYLGEAKTRRCVIFSVASREPCKGSAVYVEELLMLRCCGAVPSKSFASSPALRSRATGLHRD